MAFHSAVLTVLLGCVISSRTTWNLNGAKKTLVAIWKGQPMSLMKNGSKDVSREAFSREGSDVEAEAGVGRGDLNPGVCWKKGTSLTQTSQ